MRRTLFCATSRTSYLDDGDASRAGRRSRTWNSRRSCATLHSRHRGRHRTASRRLHERQPAGPRHDLRGLRALPHQPPRRPRTARGLRRTSRRSAPDCATRGSRRRMRAVLDTSVLIGTDPLEPDWRPRSARSRSPSCTSGCSSRATMTPAPCERHASASSRPAFPIHCRSTIARRASGVDSRQRWPAAAAIPPAHCRPRNRRQRGRPRRHPRHHQPQSFTIVNDLVRIRVAESR